MHASWKFSICMPMFLMSYHWRNQDQVEVVVCILPESLEARLELSIICWPTDLTQSQSQRLAVLIFKYSISGSSFTALVADKWSYLQIVSLFGALAAFSAAANWESSCNSLWAGGMPRPPWKLRTYCPIIFFTYRPFGLLSKDIKHIYGKVP